jgi:hypothetical protein
MHARTKAIAATLAATLVLVGCGASGGSDAADDAEATTTTAAATPPDETTTTEAASETTSTEAEVEATTTAPEENPEGVDTETSELDTLPDGDHYGFIAGLESGMVEGQAVQVIIWDEVELLTGQEAIDAAAEDGETLDTDYYVRNQNQTVRRLAVVPDASIFTLADGGGSSELVASSVDEVWQQEFLFEINVGNVREITTISSIEAVYLA